MNIPENTVSVTENAALRVKELIDGEKNPNLKLRVYIMGGGCSGFQYGFTFDEVAREDDIVVEHSLAGFPITVLVDAMSIMYLKGSTIDYLESLQGAHFTIKNPNAQTTCSCGSSFSLPT